MTICAGSRVISTSAQRNANTKRSEFGPLFVLESREHLGGATRTHLVKLVPGWNQPEFVSLFKLDLENCVATINKKSKEEPQMTLVTSKYEATETLSNPTLNSFKSYHEMLEQTVVEVNELERLKMNMKQLEDLHGRLSHAMTEIKSLMKRS